MQPEAPTPAPGAHPAAAGAFDRAAAAILGTMISLIVVLTAVLLATSAVPSGSGYAQSDRDERPTAAAPAHQS